MKTKPWAILLIIGTTFFTSIAQILYKMGANQLEFTIPSLLSNYYLLAGLALYAIGAFVVIVAFRGGEVSVLYPIIATSYIWVSFLSIYFLGEQMTLWKWLGVMTIFIGIVLIGYGSSRDKAPEGVMM